MGRFLLRHTGILAIQSTARAGCVPTGRVAQAGGAKTPENVATCAEPACGFPQTEAGRREKLYNFDHL
jgi:hypothetical protein